SSSVRTAPDEGARRGGPDRGPGIAGVDRSRVFERFQRGGSADTSGGTGLGLAIARWAGGLHGGTIEVLDDPRSEHAREGRSSLIRVVLPDTVAGRSEERRVGKECRWRMPRMK